MMMNIWIDFKNVMSEFNCYSKSVVSAYEKNLIDEVEAVFLTSSIFL